MIYLSQITSILEMVLSAQSAVDVTVDYNDIPVTGAANPYNPVPDMQAANLINVGINVICTAPPASTRRQIKRISAYNKGSTPQVLIIQRNINGTRVVDTSGTIAVGETFLYEDQLGVSVLDPFGRAKGNLSLSTSTGQQGSSGSWPVVIASDQAPVKVKDGGILEAGGADFDAPAGDPGIVTFDALDPTASGQPAIPVRLAQQVQVDQTVPVILGAYGPDGVIRPIKNAQDGTLSVVGTVTITNGTVGGTAAAGAQASGQPLSMAGADINSIVRRILTDANGVVQVGATAALPVSDRSVHDLAIDDINNPNLGAALVGFEPVDPDSGIASFRVEVNPRTPLVLDQTVPVVIGVRGPDGILRGITGNVDGSLLASARMLGIDANGNVRQVAVDASANVQVVGSPSLTTAPLQIGGIGPDGIMRRTLVDIFGTTQVNHPVSSSSNQSIQELLLQIAASCRAQAHFLSDLVAVCRGLSAPANGDEADAIIGEFMNPLNALVNMTN